MWEEVGTPSKMTFSEGKEVMTCCPQVSGAGSSGGPVLSRVVLVAAEPGRYDCAPTLKMRN